MKGAEGRAVLNVRKTMTNLTEKYLNKELSTSDNEEYNAWLDSLPEDDYDGEKAIAQAEYYSDCQREERMIIKTDKPPF